MKYDVDYYINKFSAIPSRKWTTGDFNNDKGRKCALGHCQVGMRDNWSPEANQLNLMFRDAFWYEGVVLNVLTEINDGTVEGSLSLGKHPKTRILAALELIKAGVRV